MSGLPSPTEQKAIITSAADRYGVSPRLLWGLYGEETSFGHDLSTSSAGAVGPFQFEPGTARGMGVNPYNFRSAAEGAAKYLGEYKGRGVGGMLSAYNAGPAGAYQPGYVKGVEEKAKSYGAEPKGVTQAPAAPKVPPLPGMSPGGKELDVAAFRKAETGAALGKLFSPEERAENPLFSAGVLSAKEPSPAEYMKNAPTGGTAPSRPPQGEPQTRGPGKLAGFLPANAELQMERIDQGQDIKTNPGGPIVAPGDGVVVAVKSDPSGFGPDYPVVKFTNGPLAGKSVYLGHTHSALKAGDSFKAGQVLSHTGKGPGPVGNATVPGWAEIGEASALGTGNMQAGNAMRRYFGGR